MRIFQESVRLGAIGMLKDSPIPLLLVDDRSANLVALEAILGNLGYDLVLANSGQEALLLLGKRDFAVTLLDVQMPEMDGFETARRIRKHPKSGSTPIIFITAISREDDRIRGGYEAGAVDYLFKPFDAAILKSKVAVFAELFRKSRQVEFQAELIRANSLRERDQVLENALDAVVGVNELEHVTYWNRQAESTFGWSKSEAIGRPMSELIVPPRFREAHRQGMRRFLETGEERILNRRIEVVAQRKNGAELPVELTVTPITTGTTTSFYSFLRDITERRRTEELLQEAVRTRDEFLSICSHELKTPLTSMQLQFQLAERNFLKGVVEAYSPELVTKRIRSSLVQLNRMNRLIEEMLDVSRISTGRLEMRPEPVDLVGLVREVADRFSEEFKQMGTAITIESDPELIVTCDRLRIDQVITNLLTNAGLKYGAGKPVAIRVHRKGDVALFQVLDQGIGIPQESLLKVFERFERIVSSSNISGLGLGLYISRQIIDAHAGTIHVESELGKGSTFSVELPFHAQG